MSNFKVVNVLDTEATCYEGGIFPPGEVQEVIEFGITTVDLQARKILKTYSIPVRPVMSSVSPYCTKLTGWTYADLVRQGVSFEEACRRIRDLYGGLGRLVVCDSDGEFELIERQCRELGIECPFGSRRLNISTVLALLAGFKRNRSLTRKLAALGLAPDGTLHRAGDDSLNIARILLEVVNRGSFKLS